MKQSRFPKDLVFMLLLVAIALLCGHDIRSARRAHTQSETSAKSGAPPQQLSPQGQASLRAIVQAGNLADLRWPDFSDYDKHVQKFYESYGYSLPWVKGMEPTAQARQVIRASVASRPKGTVRRGLRRAALGRPAGETQTCCAPAIRSRCGAIRSRAHRLRDEIYLRPSHRQGESETF